MKALIIAAGKGQRLRRWDGDQPKPLFKVCGLTLIERAILSAKKAGITEFVIVTGYQGSMIQKRLRDREKKLGVTIQFVQNPEWEKANGHSVLKAREVLEKEENFILMMSDHIFDWNILSSLIQSGQKAGQVTLAVDRRVNDIFDIDDATKVQTDNGAIQKIGKELNTYDAIDTGIFLCSPTLFGALEKACTEGKGSLSEAIRQMADEGRAVTYTIGNRFWQDVDTPHALREAKRVLYRSVRKDTDGVISKHLNRPISGWITRLFIRTPLTANIVTWSALVIGLLSAFLVSRGTYWDLVVGGVLFQFASIYDGVDGEMAKLKFSSSKFGEWLDTVCDNITYLAFFVGIIVGVARQGHEHLLPLGLLMGFGVVMALGTMYFYLMRFTNSGSLVTVQKDLWRDLESVEQNRFIHLLGKIKFMIKRDFFALLFMVLCVIGKPDWILILTALGANLTWIVLLTTKRELASPAEESLAQSRLPSRFK